MPYTLVKFLLWFGLAAVIGVVIGWLLRSLTCRAELAAARSTTVDDAEVTRLRHRVANLEEVVVERDRLRIKVAEMRRDEVLDAAESAPPGVAADDAGAENTTGASVEDAEALDATEVEQVDADAAAVVLGRRVEIDDLTVVEGIGPKICELCRGIGVDTWASLAAADLDALRSMLDDAGPRYRVHDPTSWPEQAALLAEGRWEDFAAYVERLTGGR